MFGGKLFLRLVEISNPHFFFDIPGSVKLGYGAMIGTKIVHSYYPSAWIATVVGVFLLSPYLGGCSVFSQSKTDAKPNSAGAKPKETKPAVEVAIAKTGLLQEPLDYIGKTEPLREVSLRSQIEGRLLKLNVNIGDPVRQGQILAQLDDTLLLTAVTQEQAELAALESEVAQVKAQVGNAEAKAEQARLELQQAKVDAGRMESLWKAGAISKQQAELAQTAAATAEQNLQATIKQIGTEQQRVAAAEKRVNAQKAVVVQNQERQSYALLASPINGVVLARVTEPGNLISPGNEVLKLGDFSSVKVLVSVSELEIGNLQIGQSVTVRLDAFANNPFPGKIAHISPAANSQALKVPIEITISNSNRRIGSGLLARVSFSSATPPRVLIPETALAGGGAEGSREQGARGKEQGGEEKGSNSESKSGTVFVVTGKGSEAKVTARFVQLGDRNNNKVEIRSGLQPGEKFVARTSGALKNGDTVRLSIISE